VSASPEPTTNTAADAEASSPPTPLRARQAAAAREAILEALLAMLEREPADEISMDALAERAGTSRRTLYRYFPTRADLFSAAGDWIYEHRLRLPIEVRATDDIVKSFAHASAELARHPRLARVLLSSDTGQNIHSPRRARRAAAIKDALAEITDHLPKDQAVQTAAMVTHLCSSRSWITLQDESGLDSESARQAVTWALETLIAELRRQNDAASTTAPKRRPAKQPE